MTRQCPSCGGFCGKAGCERDDVKGSVMKDEQQAAIEYTQRGGDQTGQKPAETRADTGLGGGDRNDNRAAFEAWISTQSVITKYGAKLHLSSCGNHYKDLRINQRWLAYQAGYQAALASPEVQALRKDAERYRAMRNAAVNDDRTFIDDMQGYAYDHFSNPQAPTENEFDAAIDAAMEKQK